MIDKILIMGAGIRGKRLFNILTDIGLDVHAFLDNDENKQNSMTEKIMCYPVDRYKHICNEVIVFISPKNSTQIEKQVRKIYPFVIGENLIGQIMWIPKSAGYQKFYPIGHFFSLYPLISQAEKECKRVEHIDNNLFGGIDFQIEKQLEIQKQMAQYYQSIPKWKDIDDTTLSKYRFRYKNPSFSHGDAIGLHTMIRIIQPKKIIEVGSGWTSAIMLDTNEEFFDQGIQVSFIEPYPEILKSILKEEDKIELIDTGLQDVELNYFDKLESGDILFIDSTHISKSGSDVNYLFFEILPRLKNGVYIHIHDIFYPFEYPFEWIRKGMVFNELYLLRAFLQYNRSYEIIYFQNMMEQKYIEKFLENWPVEAPVHGGSFWMRKK